MLAEEIKPYDKKRPKGEQVEVMFDNIAPAYDLMNTAITFGMHSRWLRKAIRMLTKKQSKTREDKILDLATGTGEVAFFLSRQFPKSEITGVDLSEGMLEIAEGKRKKLRKEDAGRISFQQGDCLNLEYKNSSFDILTIAYGIRNFENLQKGFDEFFRVLKPGGKCMILELSRPENKILRAGYNIYTKTLIPLAGRIMSRDKRAYSYLPESIAAMPPRKNIEEMLLKSGFREVSSKTLSLGVVTCYIAEK